MRYIVTKDEQTINNFDNFDDAWELAESIGG